MRLEINRCWKAFVRTQWFEVGLFAALLAIGSWATMTGYAFLTRPSQILAADCSQIAPTAVKPEAVPSGSNLLRNGSAENLDSIGQPTGWIHNVYGNNQASFSLGSQAVDGQRTLKVTVSSYTDGDAKWSFTPVPVTAGGGYAWSEMYRSTAVGDVEADVAMSDGTHQHLKLGVMPASATWKSVFLNFIAPEGAQNVTVYHLIQSVGTLETDQVAFGPYTGSPMPEGLISVTFDDGQRDTYVHGLPLLQKYGIPSTQYIISSPVRNPNGTYYMTADMVKEFAKDGHEIGSHTATHPDLATLSSSAVTQQLTDPYDYLSRLVGYAVTDFASPYGSTSPAVVKQIQQRYCSHRSTFWGFNSSDNIDPFNITVQDIAETTSVEQIDDWVDFAARHKVWIVLVMHEVEQGGRQYSFSPQNLEKVLQHIKSSNVKAVTVANGLKAIRQAQHQQSLTLASKVP